MKETGASRVDIVPDIQNESTINSYLSKCFTVLRRISPAAFQSRLETLGIRSRATYFALVKGRRRFPVSKLRNLVEAFDWSHNEKVRAQRLLAGEAVPIKPQTPYLLGTAEVLAQPLNTIVLNLSGLNGGATQESLVSTLSGFCEAAQIRTAISLLKAANLLSEDQNGTLSRKEMAVPMSTMNGVKVDYARSYINDSLDLAKAAYDLPLEKREYTAFTCRIASYDFPKVKDMVRDFRRALYALSDEAHRDAVIQVNLNTFLIGHESRRSETKAIEANP